MVPMKSKLNAIFPITSENVTPLFDERKTAFVKYTKFRKLEKGSKIVFYVSKEKKLIGEGTIVKVETTNPKIAWAHYSKQIFLDETEYNQYVAKSPVDKKSRKMTNITVFILRSLKRYKNPTQWVHDVTPSGCYVSEEKLQRIKTG